MKINLILISFLLIASNALAENGESSKGLLSALSDKLSQMTEVGLKDLDKKCSDKKPDYCFLMARYYEYKKNNPQALSYFRKACGLRHAYGCLLGGYMLERQGEETSANDLYMMGCNLGKNGGENCVALGQNAREQRDWKQALKYYAQGCDLDEKMGCFLAGEITLFLPYEKLDLGVKYYRKGCALGHASSCWYLGEKQKYRGFHDEAKEAYQKACAGAIYEACDEFKALNKGGLGNSLKKKTEPYVQEFKDKASNIFETLFPLDK